MDVRTGLISLADYKKSQNPAELEISAETLAKKFAVNFGKPMDITQNDDNIKLSEKNENTGNKLHNIEGVSKRALVTQGEDSYSVDAGFIFLLPRNDFGSGVSRGFGGSITGYLYDVITRNYFAGAGFSYSKVEGNGNNRESGSDDNYNMWIYYQVNYIKVYSYHLLIGYRYLLFEGVSIEPFAGGGVDYIRIDKKNSIIYPVKNEDDFESVLKLGINIVYRLKNLYLKLGINSGFIIGKYDTLDYMDYFIGTGVYF